MAERNFQTARKSVSSTDDSEIQSVYTELQYKARQHKAFCDFNTLPGFPRPQISDTLRVTPASLGWINYAQLFTEPLATETSADVKTAPRTLTMIAKSSHGLGSIYSTAFARSHDLPPPYVVRASEDVGGKVRRGLRAYSQSSAAIRETMDVTGTTARTTHISAGSDIPRRTAFGSANPALAEYKARPDVNNVPIIPAPSTTWLGRPRERILDDFCAVNELLEEVLLQTDHATLLQSRRVSQKFLDMIDRKASKRMRRHMFMDTTPACVYSNFQALPRFPYGHGHITEKDASGCRAKCRSVSIICLISTVSIPVTVIERRHIAPKIWNRVQISQPPVFRVRPRGLCELTLLEETIECDGGITVGHLFEASTSFFAAHKLVCKDPAECCTGPKGDHFFMEFEFRKRFDVDGDAGSTPTAEECLTPVLSSRPSLLWNT